VIRDLHLSKETYERKYTYDTETQCSSRWSLLKIRLKETYIYEKRPTYVKNDLHIYENRPMKKTYIYEMKVRYTFPNGL